MRTSSATNVGPDRDSEKRQRDAIERFAAGAGFEIVDWFYDAAVSGADPIDSRPGFAAALERIASNGVRTIVVETANRFARDLIVQETGFRLLRDQGIELIAADSPNSFVDDTPTAALIRQVLGAVAQFEKAALVAKLKGARDRKRRDTGKVEGRKRRVDRLDAEGAANLAAAVREAKRLRRASPKTGSRMSYREIAAKLEAAGYVNERKVRYNPASIKRMLEGDLDVRPSPSK
jgi:DNA invertase Pin-like site-specific DNA recombinase